MKSLLRILGRVLSMVGISSPEDTKRPGSPSWRDKLPQPPTNAAPPEKLQ